jgi:hypothetical protein
VINNTPISRTSNIGIVARMTSIMGMLKRYDESKRFKPTGGARKPSSMLARKNNSEMDGIETKRHADWHQ